MVKEYYQTITHNKTSLREILEERFERKFDGASIPDCILILSALCGLISPEELNTFFPFLTYDTLRKHFNNLVRSHLMTQLNLYHKKKQTADGRSSVLYHLTPKGVSYVKKKYLPKQPPYKKPSEKYAYHDYGSSWNFMALIANPFLPTIRGIYSELLYNDGRISSNVRTDGLRIDGTAYVGDSTMYIEEDRDTESIKVLRQKFKIYGFQGFNLAKNNSFVVLSMKKPFVSLIEPMAIRHGKNIRYSVKHLQATVELFKEHPEFKKGPDYLFHDLHEAIVAGKIPHSSSTELAEALYKECEEIGFTDCSFTVDRPGALSIDVLIEEHLNELKGFWSSVYSFEYGRLQEKFSDKKRHELLQLILKDSDFGTGRFIDAPDILYYLSGFRLFMGPTYMIDKVYFFAFYEHTEFKSVMERTIEQYMPNIDFSSYLPKYVIANESPLRRSDAAIKVFSMRNGYDSPKWAIFVENLAYDLSAAVRIKAASETFNKKRVGEQGVLVICLVRSDEEARYFYNLLNLRSVPLNSDLRFLFINIRPALEWIHPNGYRLMYDRLTPGISPLYALTSGGTKQIVAVSKKYNGE